MKNKYFFKKPTDGATDKITLLVINNASDWRKPLYDAISLYLKERTKKNIEHLSFSPKSSLLRIIFKKSFYVALSLLTQRIVTDLITGKQESIKFSYKNIAIGRYLAADALRDPETSISYKKYYKKVTKKAFKASFYFAYAEILSKKISYAYLHDTPYLLGIVNDTLMTNGVKVFLKGYPYTILLVDTPCKSQIEPFFLRNNRPGFSKDETEAYINERLFTPKKHIKYLQADERSNADIKIPTQHHENYIIYAHSFTDAQLIFGYDGFSSVYEWLLYTVRIFQMQSKNIIIKGHPNFWAPDHQSHVIKWDREIWKYVCNYFEGFPDITLIDQPLNNATLLNALDTKNTLLISHHGNALVEGAALGFKTLSSKCSLWSDQYLFGEVWSSKAEYKEKLQKNLETLYSDSTEAHRFIHDKYLNPKGYHGRHYWRRILAERTGIKEAELERHPHQISTLQIPNYENALHDITKGITTTSEILR